MKYRPTGVRIIAALLLCIGTSVALAHESKHVGEGQYRLSVGFIHEPIYTEERNGLDLIIRPAGQREPIPGLEEGLHAEIIAPNGDTRKAFDVRPRYPHPGRYTFDIILTEPGQYQVRVWGNIHDVSFDETFSLSEVKPISVLHFPQPASRPFQ